MANGVALGDLRLGRMSSALLVCFKMWREGSQHGCMPLERDEMFVLSCEGCKVDWPMV